jgi:carboxypeptidase Taq
MIGYFPTYSLGNLYSAQFFAAAKRDIPALDDEMARGEFGGLLKWLREKIHVHGNVIPRKNSRKTRRARN